MELQKRTMEKAKKEESSWQVITVTPAIFEEQVKPLLDAEKERFEANAEKTKLEITRRVMGYPGVMISGSKSGYHDRFPDHDVIFNANIFTEAGKKIWYGDIDITLSTAKLQTLSKELGEKIFVLYEWDGRFDFETNPQLDKAPWTCEPNGVIVSRFS